jgi:Tol biopolymer transport system component/DNA-binding winged helix-turn-helix (wHTH) protein
MSASPKRSYEFGSFRLDAAEYVLLRDGQIVPLTPKAFETLLVLVQNSGHVVDKGELYKQVWQDAFVEETNLTKNISILRKVLSEGDGDTTFIETVPKRGYRFVVPVRESGTEYNGNGSKPVANLNTEVVHAPATTTAAESLFSRIKNSKYVFASVLGIAAVVLAGLGFGVYKFAFLKKTSISLTSAHISRLTSSGIVSEAEITPDGKWLVYAERAGDHHSLWLKQIAVPESAARITAPIVGSSGGLAISPDGKHVYYTVNEPGRSESTLYRVPIVGGPERKLFTGIIGPVTFSPDGERIAYFHWINDEDRLMIANADGSGQRQLVTRSGNECFVNANNGPSWSPDGKTLLTSIGTFAPELSMTVATVSPDNGTITRFSEHKFQQIIDVEWLSGGQSVLVVANDQFNAGGSKIWQISYPAGKAQRITNDLNGYNTLSLTADSNTLVTVQYEILGNLWITALNDAAYTPITTGTNLASFPSWTPDGKVVYELNSGGNFDLYLLDPRERVPKRLTGGFGNNRSPVVSPDGRYVVFTSDRTGILCLWRIDIDGSHAKQLNNQTSLWPSFAPDARTIVYTSLVNKYTSSTIDLDGGEPHQLNEDESFAPVFSPDGSNIACFYRGGPDSPFRISIIPAAGGSPVKAIPTQKGTALQLRWTPDGKALVYPVTQGGVSNLWMQAIEGGAPKQLTNFTSDLIFSFDISRDGKRLIVSRGTNRSDAVLFSGIKQ